MGIIRLGLVSREFRSSDLGDERLNRRLGRISDALAAAPDSSLPRAVRTSAALEATYRFLSNSRVQPDKILEPHIEATCQRAEGESALLAIHDTTEFGLGGESRAYVGRTNSSKPGFFAHVSLAVRAIDRQPLGVLALRTYARLEPAAPKKKRRTHAYRSRADKESHRWGEAAAEVDDRLGMGAAVIHVMDREADQYRLLSQLSRAGSRFVIRGKHDRILTDEACLSHATATAPVVLRREVALSARKPKHKRSAHKPREARIATLDVAATAVEVKRSHGRENRGLEESLKMNVVRVAEVGALPDEDPVEWVLLTNLPVETEEQIAFVVDCYRARWIVEEFFKAVKTGCAYEKLQLESHHALANALAVIAPIAWQMLLLRGLARCDDDIPATRVLTKEQIAVLRSTPWTTLPAHPTVKEALSAVATIGGHIRNNGEPGWQVLYRGFRDLMLLQAGWRARCDQS